MARGLNYKFKLQDLHKYSQRLQYKDINWVLGYRKVREQQAVDVVGHELSEEELKALKE